MDALGRHHPLPGTEYPEEYYGFGIRLSSRNTTPGHGTRGDLLWHGGQIPGSFSSLMARFIPSQRCIITLENNDNAEITEEVTFHLEEILFS